MSQTDIPSSALVFRTADLPGQGEIEVNLKLDRDGCNALAKDLGIEQLKKLSFSGTLRPAGARDWVLSGHLGATVQQSCVVTLEPVTTRIEDTVLRQYIADWQDPEEVESEMPEDDSTEPLGDQIDAMAAITEALLLAVPAYPRKEGAELGALVYAEPGVEPLTEDTVKPFASLAALKDKMEKGS